MSPVDRPYFQLEQARQVAEVFAKHHVEFMFIGKGGAIILGYPAATQDVDLYTKKSPQNGSRIIDALGELEFGVDEKVRQDILAGVD